MWYALPTALLPLRARFPLGARPGSVSQCILVHRAPQSIGGQTGNGKLFWNLGPQNQLVLDSRQPNATNSLYFDANLMPQGMK